MKAVATVAVLAFGVAPTLAGCGGGGVRSPDQTRLPIVHGSSIVERVQQCDHGTQAYCAIEMVIADSHVRTSWELVKAEQRALAHRRWTTEEATNGDEHAAQSPGDKLRVTYATAYGDLQGIDLGWIQRAHRLTIALTKVLFDRAPAISVMLEVGS